MKAKTKNKIAKMYEVSWKKKVRSHRVWKIKAVKLFAQLAPKPILIGAGMGTEESVQFKEMWHKGSVGVKWIDAEAWKLHTDFYGL